MAAEPSCRALYTTIQRRHSTGAGAHTPAQRADGCCSRSCCRPAAGVSRAVVAAKPPLRSSRRALCVCAVKGPATEHKTPAAAVAANPGSRVQQELLTKGTPYIKRAVTESPGFAHLVETHTLIAQRVEEQLPGGLARAPVGAADGCGWWCAASIGTQPASSCILTYSSEHLHAGVQVFAAFTYGPDGGPLAERVHTQTLFHTPDGVLTPSLDFHLSMECGDPDFFVFYGALGQKLNLGCHLDYVDKYYYQPPKVAPAGMAAASNGNGNGNGNGAAAGRQHAVQLPSFQELEEQALKDPAYRCRRDHAHTMRSRSMAAGAMFYRIRHDGANPAVLDRVRHHALSLTDIWLGHMLYDIATGEGRAAGRGDCIARECALASQVERNATKLDPNTQYLVPVYGREAVEAMLATIAGEPSPLAGVKE